MDPAHQKLKISTQPDQTQPMDNSGLEQQNYREVQEGAVESQNYMYVRERLTKKECLKTLTEDGQRRRLLDVRWQ